MNEIVIFTAQSYTAKFEPIKMVQELRTIKNMGDAIKSDPNSLAFYRKQIGEDTITAVIELHLISLGQSLNVHEKLSRQQCGEIALEIMTLYYFMNMVEIAHVFRKAKRGEYGPIKYAINMPDVLQWFAKYSEERIKFSMINADSIAAAHIQNSIDSKNLDKMALDVLKTVKEELPKGFNNEAFKQWKKDNNQ